MKRQENNKQSRVGSTGQIVKKDEGKKVKVGSSCEDLPYRAKDTGLQASRGTE